MKSDLQQVTGLSDLRAIMDGTVRAKFLSKIPVKGAERTAILGAIGEALMTVLVLRPDNFTPPERTPWGGRKIREIMKGLGLAAGGIVGEAWIVSGHESFPSRISFTDGKEIVEVPFTLIGELFPNELFGPANVARHGRRAPFLTKLVDARENLSVQVHPAAGYAARFPKKGWRPKTEMWVILGARRGAGLYLGLKEGVTRAEFSRAVESGDDVSMFLNFTPVKAGDIFFIPAGTVHAIGAGVFLAEHQETSETTFRVYSWNDGRKLQKKDGIAAIDFDAPRGERLVGSLRRTPVRVSGGGKGQALHESLAIEKEFSFDRISFKRGDRFRGDASKGMQGLTVIDGKIEFLINGKSFCKFEKGQTFIVPARAGKYELVAKGRAEVFLGKGVPRSDTLNSTKNPPSLDGRELEGG